MSNYGISTFICILYKCLGDEGAVGNASSGGGIRDNAIYSVVVAMDVEGAG